MSEKSNRIYSAIKVLTYLPGFLAYVFGHFPSARLTVLVALVGVILEYAALSVMLPLAGSQKNTTISSVVIAGWQQIIQVVGLPNESRTWVWIFLLLLGLRIAVSFAQITLNTWVSKCIFTKLSTESLARVVSVEPLAEIYRRSIGYYTALAGDEAVRVGQVFFHLSQIVSALIAAVIGLFALYIFSPLAFSLTMVFLGLAAVSFGFIMKRFFSWSNESALIRRETHTTFIEAFNGIRSIRSMGGEEYVSARYHSAQNRYGRLLFLLDTSTFGLRSMPGLILIGLGLIVLFPSAGFYPEFSEIYFFTVTTMLIRILTFMGTVVTSGGRVAIDFRAAFDLKELTGKTEENTGKQVTESLVNEVTEIKLTDLCCGYLAEHPVLVNVSATLAAGRSYALVGKSGSGKSTLSDVLLGLLPPQSGAIQITDHHYHQINMASLRKKVVLVEQQTRIFSDTVRENITFGFAASQQEVELAVAASGLSDFIASLPNGLETRLDYQGANLSGGQRQRIGLARALVRRPDVLILDEATSALDSSTRDLILQHLRELFHDKILLFITHDHHLTQTVDEIWHIKQGKLGIEIRQPVG